MHSARFSLLSALVMLASAIGLALVAHDHGGTWPDSWPKELEPLRKNAVSHSVMHGTQETVYEISFENREQFEAAWPHLLKLKTKGAPIYLEKIPSSYGASYGTSLVTGVRVLWPADGYCGGPPVEEGGLQTTAANEQLVKEGKVLRSGAPWPAYLFTTTGELPEYVAIEQSADPPRWIDAKAPEAEIKVNGRKFPPTGHRARVDLMLVPDGEIIDLNRVFLPPETPIIDHRF